MRQIIIHLNTAIAYKICEWLRLGNIELQFAKVGRRWTNVVPWREANLVFFFSSTPIQYMLGCSVVQRKFQIVV